MVLLFVNLFDNPYRIKGEGHYCDYRNGYRGSSVTTGKIGKSGCKYWEKRWD